MTKNNSNKIYYVNGMHCASCQILIEKELSKISGIEKANVSLKKNCVELIGNEKNFPSTSNLNKTFEELGYVFSTEKPVEQKLSTKDIKKIFIVFLAFLSFFYVIESSGFFLKLAITPQSSAISYVLLGLVAGLSSCAALVGGILLTLSSQWNKLYNGNAKKSEKPFIYFNIARLFSFAFFGGILGLVGSLLVFSITTTAILTLIISFIMLVIGLQLIGITWAKKISLNTPKTFSKYIADETNFKGKFMPFVAGALTFFVPCGFTLIAQTNALASGSALMGAVSLLAFAIGTLPMLILISFFSIKLYNNPAFSKKFNYFSGLLLTFFALYTANSQLNVLGLPSLNDVQKIFVKNDQAKIADYVGDTQFMQLEAVGFEYFPKVINLKAGIKTKLEVYNSGATGCAQALYAKGLYPDVIYLKDGLNSVEFTPKKGTYKVSCSMGMVPPVTVYVR